MTEYNQNFLDRINYIETLLYTGKYREALTICNDILQDKLYSSEKEEIQMLIIQSAIYSRIGTFEYNTEFYDMALETIEQAYSQSVKIKNLVLMFDSIFSKVWSLIRREDNKLVVDTISEAEQIFHKLEKENVKNFNDKQILLYRLLDLKLLLKSFISEEKWDFETSQKYLFRALEICQDEASLSNKQKFMKGIILSSIANNLSRVNKYDDATEYWLLSLKIYDEIGELKYKTKILEALVRNYLSLGKYDYAYNSIIELEQQLKELNDDKGQGSVLLLKGYYYREKGEWLTALQNTKKAYKILSENGKRKEQDWILSFLGYQYFTTGDYDNALECYKKALISNRNKGWEYAAHGNLERIAEIYLCKGDLDKSLEIMEEVLAFHRKMKSKYSEGFALKQISSIYKSKGVYDKALEKLKQSLDKMIEVANQKSIAAIYYEIVLLTTEFSKLDLAEKYNNSLKKIAEENDDKYLTTLSIVSQALILKNSSAKEDWNEAELLLEKVLEKDILYDVRIEVLFHHCELLLKKLKITSDELVLNKLQKQVEKLVDISSINKIPKLQVECLWFDAQLSLLKLDFDNAKELLTEAQLIAEEKGMYNLALKITKSKEFMLRQIISKEEIVKDKESISERMDLLKITNGFEEIKKIKNFDVGIQLKSDI